MKSLIQFVDLENAVFIGEYRNFHMDSICSFWTMMHLLLRTNITSTQSANISKYLSYVCVILYSLQNMYLRYITRETFKKRHYYFYLTDNIVLIVPSRNLWNHSLILCLTALNPVMLIPYHRWYINCRSQVFTLSYYNNTRLSQPHDRWSTRRHTTNRVPYFN